MFITWFDVFRFDISESNICKASIAVDAISACIFLRAFLMVNVAPTNMINSNKTVMIIFKRSFKFMS